MKIEKEVFVPFIAGKLGKSEEEAKKLHKKLEDFEPTAKVCGVTCTCTRQPMLVVCTVRLCLKMSD